MTWTKERLTDLLMATEAGDPARGSSVSIVSVKSITGEVREGLEPGSCRKACMHAVRVSLSMQAEILLSGNSCIRACMHGA